MWRKNAEQKHYLIVDIKNATLDLFINVGCCFNKGLY